MTVHNPVFSAAIKKISASFSLDIEIEIHSGICVLTGPSGSGKTLTLRCISGLISPDSGLVQLKGKVLFDSANRIDVKPMNRSIGYVFQQYALFPYLTVKKNILYGLNSMPVSERESRVNEVLNLFEIGGLKDRYPDEISGGQQQRVALARAIAPSPSLLLLDEPFNALDAPLRRRLGSHLQEIHEATRVPMLMVTHDPEEAERIAYSRIEIDNGRLIGLG